MCLGTKCRYRKPNTEYRIPNTEYRIQVHVLPTEVDESEADTTVKGLVRFLRFSLLDRHAHDTRQACIQHVAGDHSTGTGQEEEDERKALGDVWEKDGVGEVVGWGGEGGAGGVERQSLGQGKMQEERMAYRRVWQAGALAEVRMKWCKLCRGLGRSDLVRGEGAWELHHVSVFLDDVPLGSCHDPQVCR